MQNQKAHITLSPVLKQEMQEYAKSLGISFSQLATYALINYKAGHRFAPWKELKTPKPCK